MKKINKTLFFSLILVAVMLFSFSSILATSNYDQKTYKVGPTIYKQDCCSYRKPYTYSWESRYFRERGFWERDYYISHENKNTVSYSQCSRQETRKSFLGDYVKEYSVYVKNRGKTGRYFTVKFEFKDNNGYEFSELLTHYIKTGEEKKFVYRDIQYERNEILDWDYEIIP